MSVAVEGGVNVSVGDSVRVVVKVLVAVFVIVGVNDIVGVKGLAGKDVSVDTDVSAMIIAVTVGMEEAISDDAAAPTDETSWATINTMATKVAAMLREARDLLA
jgi:hypothetical protein